MSDRKHKRGKTARSMRSGQKPKHTPKHTPKDTKPSNETPIWQQEKQPGSRSSKGYQSRPRAVEKKYWRM